ncbi:MAG TPA: hypothetical protein VHE35_21545 [Kofleriaceae bacterium]|nr:hypothetical protein [Kofleriaceae bacterium]
MRAILLTAAATMAALGACGSDPRPIDLPDVPAGAYEADCQRLCTLTAGDDVCTATHAAYCVAACRARTNGLPPACASCIIAHGQTIQGQTDSFGDPFCNLGGPEVLTACRSECDDAGSAVAEAALSSLCDLECGFYMQDETPLACSADGSADCRNACAAAVAARGRVCAQCLIEQTQPSRTCINGDCDCEPFFPGDPSLGCDSLCDDQPPS